MLSLYLFTAFETFTEKAQLEEGELRSTGSRTTKPSYLVAYKEEG